MAQTAHTPKQAIYLAKDFKFQSGETISELKLGYTTLGDPTGQPVLILHGTAGTGTGMLNPAFGGQLFGPGQVLDANKYFIILPDAVGVGASSKPSDGLRMKFPKYNYDDMVSAQHRLVTEGLGLKHLRLVLGNSMGGMQTWLWGVKYPNFMDALVPMAAMPAPMSGRNWMTRRLIIDSIRNDPAWQQGNYSQQPPSLQFASVFFSIATSGGNQGLQKLASSRTQADQLLNQRLAAASSADANDNLYQWESSGDYDPSDKLENIRARRAAIAAGCDEMLFIDATGQVIEGAGTNLFVVRDGIALTPPLSVGPLPGIARGLVLALLGPERSREAPIDIALLHDATEVFVTNALMGVMPVSRIENHDYDVLKNPFTRALQENYRVAERKNT